LGAEKTSIGFSDIAQSRCAPGASRDLPQHTADPLANTAHVKSDPAAKATTEEIADT
jgi:hypothetical protein